MKRLEKGFTLIELMIVVAIIAILAAVAAPRFGKQLQTAKDGKAIQIVGNWRSALTMNYADTTVYSTTFGPLLEYVDDNTKAKTYKTLGGTDDFGTDANANTSNAFVEGGKSDQGTNKNEVEFAIVGTTVDASVKFTTTNGVDAKNKNWTTY